MRKTYSALGRVTPLLLVLSLAVGTPALAQVGGFARGGKPDGGGGWQAWQDQHRSQREAEHPD